MRVSSECKCNCTNDAGIGVFYLMIASPIGANFIDNIIMRNWKSKEAKMENPFANPFGMSFPLFDMADDPLSGILKEEAAQQMRRKEVRKAKLPKPWFSISEFLSLPEMSRKTNSDGRKLESSLVGGKTAETAAPNDKITQTGTVVQTKSTSNDEGEERKKRNSADQSERNDSVGNQLTFDLMKPENHTATKSKISSKFSFPKGFSDILIIFQKVGPKLKSSRGSSPSNHECDEFCRNGVCEMRGPWNRVDKEIEQGTLNTDEVPPEPTKAAMAHHRRGPLMGQYDRICILVIPIALAIGTLLFIIELRRIFRKMKKQSVLSTFDHQEC